MRWTLIVAPLALAGYVWASPPPDDEDTVFEFAPSPIMGELVSPMSMGATPGGAQDIDYARQRIAAGEVPTPRPSPPKASSVSTTCRCPPRPARRCSA